MDTRDLEAAGRSAQASLLQADSLIDEMRADLRQQQSQADLAKAELERYRALVQKDYDTREDLDQRQQAYDGAVAALGAMNAKIHEAQHARDAARHVVELANVNIRDNVLVAPRDGRILYRIANLYMANGGSSAPLHVHSLVQTEEYRARLNAVHPPSWMRHPTKPEEIPIDMEPTGLCFDIERPAAAWNRKVLEYALGLLADRNQIYWVEEAEQGPHRYHICPSPEHRSELARLR